MTTPETCAAPASNCGTPSGWRQGGRCLRCRHAHNQAEQDRRHPPLSPAERQAALAALRAGHTPDQAAAVVDRGRRSLHYYAATDRELAAALAGEPIEVQHRARLGDYLAATLRHRCDEGAARAELGVTAKEVEEWAQMPYLSEVVAAVRMLYRRDLRPRELRTLWLDGVPADEIAERLGYANGAVVSRMIRPMGLPRRRAFKRFTEKQKKLLAELWLNDKLTNQQIADLVGAPKQTLSVHARAMGLPLRKRGRKFRKDDSDLPGEAS